MKKIKRVTLSNFDEIILECLIECYALSITYDGSHGDFNKLMENATIDDKGRKRIPFMHYFLSEELFDQMFIRFKEKYNLNQWYFASLKANIALGASPTSSYEAWIRERNNKGYL